MPLDCSSHDLCADFIAAARRVVDDAEAVHTSTHAEGGYCNMPGTCGPTVWAVLHGIAGAMRDEVCVHCGEEAVRLMNGLHDVVNRKLGRPLQQPDDLAFLVELATTETHFSTAAQGSGNVPHLKDLDEVIQFAEDRTGENIDVYVYWGVQPPSPHHLSFNALTGEYEKGLSAIALLLVNDKKLQELVMHHPERHRIIIANRLTEYRSTRKWRRDAKPYLITGRQVSIGGDKEPLLADIRVLAQAPIDLGEADEKLLSESYILPLPPQTARESTVSSQSMPAPFGWPGGKKNLKHRIVELIPPHTTYVEPFAGAASVFFLKEPSQMEVLNDLDADLMRFYAALPTLQHVPTAELARRFPELHARRGELEPEEFFSLITCSFGSKGEDKSKVGIGAKVCTNNAPQFHSNLPLYRERLKGVKLHNEDWEKIVRRYDSPSTFFYLDPPYHGTQRPYKEGHDQLARLAAVLPTLQGQWLVTLDDHLDVRKAFQGFSVTPVESHYTLAKESNDRPGKQLLISNYHLGQHHAKSEVAEVKKMISIHAGQLPLDHEVGAPIYRCGTGDLGLGNFSSGGLYNVDIPMTAPVGCEPIGTLHTHPGGPATPSAQDMSEAHRLGMSVVCVTVPETGETICRRV